MSFEENKLNRYKKRKPFRDSVKIFCKLNDVRQKNLAEVLGITKQEFSFLLSGKLSSIPTKGIENYSDFEVRVMNLLGSDFTQGRMQC